ncbi:MAG: hypothetical protein MMC33_004537 [Icmadophila ericetorum]|nr:hypothetical protein [Icmadophila ericetorum]
MRFFACTLSLLPLLQQGSAVQFEIPQVQAAVNSMLTALSKYVHYTAAPSIRPAPAVSVPKPQGYTPYWLENIQHQGIAPYGPGGYTVFRNVMDYGATGNGVTDDTAAINAAISAGGRCGEGCASTTTTPAVVYFPAGTYLISSPIVDYFYTQLIGNPNALPTLRASGSFSGFALIDADPYYTSNLNWGSTNVFYRQIRNMIIDMTAIPCTAQATGIHWPTAQATSLQNLVFDMCASSGTQHVGLFIESGSAGFITDLVFNGGLVGAEFGNQQYTTRNLTFNNAVTAISHFWDWGWTYAGVTINNCGTGIAINAGGTGSPEVGSIILIDSVMNNVPVGITTAYVPSSNGVASGSVVLENVAITNVPIMIQGPSGTTLQGTSGSETFGAWGQGHSYTPNGPQSLQGGVSPNSRPGSLLSGDSYYVRSKPQYNNLPLSSFQSTRSSGAAGNGVTDDTYALQMAINNAAAAGAVLFWDAGVYRVTSTLTMPPGSKWVGETYSVIMSSGSFFNNMNSPQPVVQIGQSGQAGQIEWSDMIVSTQGPQAGAILIQFNLAASGQPSGLWDVHARIGGFVGSDLQVAQCPTTPNSATINTNCIAGYMTMHVTPSASNLYLENVWLWTADHDIDNPSNAQLTIYNGRGLYIESTSGQIWLWGTAVEHHTLYQYQFANTQNIFGGQMQTETPYYQPNPGANVPFPAVSSLNDPIMASNQDAWGLRIVDSHGVNIYGVGLYSFFDNYSTACSQPGNGEACQSAIFSIDSLGSGVSVYNLNTVGTTNMIEVGGQSYAVFSDNINVFPDTIALFRT